MERTLFVGLDVRKLSISVAAAEGECGGEVRFLSDIPNGPTAVTKALKKLAKNGQSLDLCHEAGPCGYGLYRRLSSERHCCIVVAPSRIPTAPGDRIKTDRRDAQRLAVLHRAGDLTPVWVPDETHEAMRDLVRARIDTAMQLMRTRQQLLAFLLRHDRVFETGRKHRNCRHRRWLSAESFDEPVQNIVFQDYVEAVWTATDRRDALVQRIGELTEGKSLHPLVQALRCFHGLELVPAATFLASVGDLTRFDNLRQLTAYLGLAPSGHSNGQRIVRGGITKTGNCEARRMLVEAAWSYRYPARVSRDKFDLLIDRPKIVRDIAWKAQERLCKRYRRLSVWG